MKDYVILTDSCCDLGADMLKKYNVEYIKMFLTQGDKEYPVDLEWKEFSAKEFYDKMRGGALYRTVQVTVADYEEKFESIVKSGKGVLSVTMSSGLSGSINASQIARKTILEKYPDATIVCVDAMRASLGQGLMVVKAAEMRAAGKSAEEAAEWIEKNKMNVHQVGSVPTLTYLKRAGRVTGMAAMMCKIMDIKPIIISDTKGQNKTVAKVRGRNTSIKECIRMAKETIIDAPSQTAYLVHADCEDAEVEAIKKALVEEVGCKDVYANYVGPVIGATVGPGMFGIYYLGTPVTE